LPFQSFPREGKAIGQCHSSQAIVVAPWLMAPTILEPLFLLGRWFSGRMDSAKKITDE
jgi:hypothetical protein